MTKLLVWNDAHIADRPPVGRTDAYAINIRKKLEEIAELGRKFGVDAIVSTGDIFHQKRANRVSHWLVGLLIEVFASYPKGAVIAVPGNHDLSSDGMAGLARQPIWTLHMAGVCALLHAGDSLAVNDILLIGREWNEERAADASYYQLTSEEQAKATSYTHTILVAHGPLLPPNAQARVYESLSVSDIDLTGIDAILCGHCHEDLGIHYADATKNKHFANVGSISRTARTISNLARKPAVVLVESEGTELRLTRHHLKSVLPAGEVFEGGQPSGDSEGIDDALAEFVKRFSAGLQVEQRNIHELLAEYGDLSREEIKLAIHYLEEGGLL